MRTVLIWLLAVFWLPATLHCAMEQAGIAPVAVEDCCAAEAGVGSESSHGCAGDACDLIEGSFYKHSVDIAKVPPALLSCLYCLAPEEPPADVKLAAEASASGDTLLALPNAWQFVLRAALPARAPNQLA